MTLSFDPHVHGQCEQQIAVILASVSDGQAPLTTQYRRTEPHAPTSHRLVVRKHKNQTIHCTPTTLDAFLSDHIADSLQMGAVLRASISIMFMMAFKILNHSSKPPPPK